MTDKNKRYQAALPQESLAPPASSEDKGNAAASQTPADAPEQEKSEAQSGSAYSEFGGLSQTLQERQTAAATRRMEAQQEWNRRLEEQRSARLALVNASKPEDTSRQQRKLRNLALGQAAGEFIGALFGGIHGLGSKGRGYVPKMPELYKNTMQRMQQLKDNDVSANEKFRNLMGSMQEQNAADLTAVAQARYKESQADEKYIQETQDKLGIEAVRAENRMGISEHQSDSKADLQQNRHKQRLKEQGNAAALKGTAGSGARASGDVAYVTKLLLPETRTSTTTGGKFPTTTVKDATSYNKQEVAAAEALAQQIAPIRKRYGLSDSDIRTLHKAIMANPKLGVTWDHVADALARLTPKQILESLE